MGCVMDGERCLFACVLLRGNEREYVGLDPVS